MWAPTERIGVLTKTDAVVLMSVKELARRIRTNDNAARRVDPAQDARPISHTDYVVLVKFNILDVLSQQYC